MGEYPKLLHTAIDAVNAREVAEFYRELLGLQYRQGDEPPTDGSPDDADWLVLTTDTGERTIAVQKVDTLHRTTWPEPDVPMQLHLDFTVASTEELQRHHARALELGATDVLDRSDDDEEPLYVLADPAGHPFCIFVA